LTKTTHVHRINDVKMFTHSTMNQWRRQLWGTGARAPSTSNNFIFVHFGVTLRGEPTIQVLCSLPE